MNTTPTTDTGIPEALRLTAEQRAEGRAATTPTKPALMTSTAPTREIGKTEATLAKPSGVERVKAAAKAVAARVTRAKPAPKTKAAKPAGKAKPAHKPSTVVSTDANPAKSIVPVRYKAAYAEHNDTCGTPLALWLKEATTTKNDDGRDCLDVKALKAIAKANGIDFAKYEDLNNGQKRMNVGNRLVGILNSGKDVTVAGKLFKASKHKPAEKGKKAQPPKGETVAKAA